MSKFIHLTNTDYAEICSLLDIDQTQDYMATAYLSKRINWFKTRLSSKIMKRQLTNKIAFIFGAGPSLPQAIQQCIPLINKYHEKIVVVAADGAILALQENGLSADIIVTDLDGSIPAIRNSHQTGSTIVVHAHGDNLSKLKEIEDILPTCGIIGSTQVKSTFKVSNYGGFTDGDRAVYLTANFNAEMIILHAFDFGTIISKYSKPNEHTTNFKASKRKLIKFDIAKKLLSKLPGIIPNINCYNATINGEMIDNWKHIDFQFLENLFEQ